MSLFKSYKVYLQKSNKTINVSKVRNLLDVLIEEEVPIDYACQNVFCGRCKVHVLEGLQNLEQESANERDVKARCGYGPNERLTCKLRLKGDIVIDL